MRSSSAPCWHGRRPAHARIAAVGWPGVAMDDLSRHPYGSSGPQTETGSRQPPHPDLSDPESIDRLERARASASPRRWPWVLASIVLLAVAMLAAFAASHLRTPVYAAVTDVLFSESDSLPAQSMERQIATQAVVLASRDIIGPVADEHAVAFDELSDRLSVEILRDTNVIRLRVEADDPQVAQELAGGVVDRYLEHHASTETAANGVTEVLERNLVELEEELADVNERVSRLDGERATPDGLEARSAEQVRLESRATMLSQRIASLQDRLLDEELDRSSRATPEIIAEASALPEPVTPTLLESLAAAGVAGILVAGSLFLAGLVLRPRLGRRPLGPEATR
jgi:uncharacterized protein involved in exopolysaccharide biosynthesis